MTERILIFGALGRVGSAVIKALPPDTPIRAADLSSGVDYPKNVESFLFDLTDPSQSYSELFEGMKKMFLIWPPGTNAKTDLPPLIRAAEKQGVKQVVFLSILEADKLRVVPHRAVELMLEESGMDWVFIRSAYFMQNLSGIHAPEIKENGEIFMPAGYGKIGLIDVRDVAAVAAKALIEGHQNQAYNLTGPQALNFNEVAGVFTEVLGRQISYANPGAIRFFRTMRKREIPAGLAVFMVIEYLMTKLGKSGLVTGEVERLLGKPATPLKEFVADFAACW